MFRGVLADDLVGLKPEQTLSSGDVQAAVEKSMRDAGIDPDFGPEPLRTPVLWFSPDGSRWTAIDIAGTFGRDDLPHFDGRVVVGSDAVILLWVD